MQKDNVIDECYKFLYATDEIDPQADSLGKKNDQEKPDLSLIPQEALFAMAKAFTYGANKYGRNNFREGIKVSRCIAAAMRHTSQFNSGEDIDEDSSCEHLGNAMASLAMAIWMHKNKPEMDDRWKSKK